MMELEKRLPTETGWYLIRYAHDFAPKRYGTMTELQFVEVFDDWLMFYDPVNRPNPQGFAHADGHHWAFRPSECSYDVRHFECLGPIALAPAAPKE